MKFEHMREYLVLADELNYSTAANRLFISQSALSRHVAQLEEEIGVPLLNRTTHFVELTPMGEKAYHILQDMSGKYEALLSLGKNYRNQVSGKLVLGLLYYSANDFFQEFIPNLKKQYPSISIECRTYQPNELYRDVLNGKIDAGVMGMANYPGSEQIRFHKLIKTDMIAMLGQQHRLANRTGIRLKELRHETLVELTDDFCSCICTRELLKKCGMFFETTLETEQIELVPYVITKNDAIHLTGVSCSKQNSPGVKYIPVLDKDFKNQESFLYRVDNANPVIPIVLKELDAFLHI